MRIAVIGATGTIGAAVAHALSEKHEVVRASRHGDIEVDIEDRASIAAFYGRAGELDAVVCCAGAAKFGKLAELDDADFEVGLRSKLMGQINLVRFGRDVLREGGSFTLTSGVLSVQPMPGSSAIATVNGGIEAFVRAAALELPRGQRINVVSPGWVTETMEAMGMDSSPGMPAAEVARAYVESLMSTRNGEVLSPVELLAG